MSTLRRKPRTMRRNLKTRINGRQLSDSNSSSTAQRLRAALYNGAALLLLTACGCSHMVNPFRDTLPIATDITTPSEQRILASGVPSEAPRWTTVIHTGNAAVVSSYESRMDVALLLPVQPPALGAGGPLRLEIQIASRRQSQNFWQQIGGRPE